MTPITTARGGAAIALLLTTTVGLAQSPQPAGDEQTRWWNHVRTLADDGLEGRQTGSDGYRKAVDYVVSQFEKAGLKPAGSKGYLQSVAFSRRRILEDQSRVALVRDGKEDVLRFGDDVTINLRAELTPAVEAPLVFAGYGLSAPDAGYDDLAGIDLKGKVAVYIAGTPAAVTGPLVAHYQQAGVRWSALKAAGAIGSIAIPNPKTSEQPWERTAPSRLNPVMTLVDPRFNDLAGMKVSAAVNPASAGRLFAGSGHSLAELFAAADAETAAAALRPAGIAARAGDDRVGGAAVRQRRRAAARERSGTGARARRADRASRPRRGRRRGERRPHLQRRDGQRVGHRDADRGRAHAGVGGRRGRNGRSCSSRSRRKSTACSARACSPAIPPSPKSAIVANINMDMFLPLYPMKSVMVLGLDESDLGDRVREVADARAASA